MKITGKKILIIEDNAANMLLVETLLSNAGCEVLKAWNAGEGLRLARAAAPDLILMDVSLPGMDGLEATRALRDDAATRRIPVVAVTAHALVRDRENVQEAGCAGYITKPIDTRRFIHTLEEFMS